MKNYSLKPTNENAIKMLREDPIGRREDIFRFIHLIDAIDDSCVIALNGDWGSGKTFFIKQVKLILDSKNSLSTMPEETRNAVQNAIRTNFSCGEHYSTVYYDAWTNDNHDDPILSLMYATICSRQSDLAIERKRSMLESLASITTAVSGINITNVIKTLKGEDIMASLKDSDDIRELVKIFIDSLIQEKGNRRIIFVDEMDRCKPDYAIQFLERIKHYFDDDRITFVFSVNLSQLQWTVKSYYGEGFDATRYLDKFFDLRVSIPEVDYDRYLSQQFGFDTSGSLYSTVCIQTVKAFHFSLREIERYIRLIKIAAYTHANNIGDYTFPSRMAVEFATLYIIPIVIGLQMFDMKKYSDFIAGKDVSLMLDILLTPGIWIKRAYILDRDECFHEDVNEPNYVAQDKVLSLKDRLTEIYRALFSEVYANNYERMVIGRMEISAKTRNEVQKIVSLLSSVSDYNFD